MTLKKISFSVIGFVSTFLVLNSCQENKGTKLHLIMHNDVRFVYESMVSKNGTNEIADSILKIYKGGMILADSLFNLCGGANQHLNIRDKGDPIEMQRILHEFYLSNKITYSWIKERKKHYKIGAIDYFFMEYYNDGEEYRFINYEKAKTSDIFLSWLRYLEWLSYSFWKLNCDNVIVIDSTLETKKEKTNTN